MDSEGRIIPIVEDDQGEGFVDVFEDIIEGLGKESTEAKLGRLSHLERSTKRERNFFNKGKIH